ncbi:MAG: FKBP-type peptidyl-prolyl cis-trans isomerase [Bacteroidales bacterium]|nr:FKBP-type peptidyl-prolyl cis-trans isomerase [Bacteroidales bacterium]
MIKHFSKFIPVFICAAVLCSCSKDESESTETIYNRILSSWIKVNYGSSAQKTEEGAYILHRTEGTGTKVGDSSYVFVSYATKTLAGDYVSTNRKELSQQLGNFAYNTYYGDAVWRVGQGAIYPGLEEVLKQMRVGGTVEVALPISATTITSSLYDLFSSSGEESNIIFEVTLDGVVEDIYAYQDEQLRAYSERYFNGRDTTIDGLYLIKTVESPEADSIGESSSIKVRYIGKLLSNFVFDTNIEDTAKKYRFYDSDNSYDALDITFETDWSTLASSNDIVYGFANAITNMRYGEEAFVFFRSDYGYGVSGNSGTVPEYSPLCFHIYIEPED